MERAPKENRFEFVVMASARARQLLRGAVPREEGLKKVTIAQREVLRRKVERVDNAEKRDGDNARDGVSLADLTAVTSTE